MEYRSKFKSLLILSVIVLLGLAGCAITTTYGVDPKPDPLNNNIYAFTVFYNEYTTQYDVDIKAKKLIADFMAEHNYQYFRVANVSGGGAASKMIYEVEFAHVPFDKSPASPGTTTPPTSTDLGPAVAKGTGFVIAEGGHIMTCAHVVEGANNITLRTLDGAEHEAKVVLKDEESDWCLLNAPLVSGKPIPLTQSENIGVGMTLYNMAYPLSGILENISPVAGSGNLASIQGMGGNPKHMQITVPINPGSSGSPVLDEYGNWVGLASHGLSALYALNATGSVPQGVNFCVKGSFIAELIRSSNGLVLPQGNTEKKMTLEETVKELSSSIVAITAVIPEKK